MSKKTDLLHQTFGKLLVISSAPTIKGRARWLCQCDCGNETIVQAAHLKASHTQSCGCLQIETISTRSKGNITGRKYQDPKIGSAKTVWKSSYTDGCSFETFLQLSQQNCYYCGIPPSNSFNKYKTKDQRYISKVVVEWADAATFVYNGLDRINPNKGHEENNIVPCCFRCNRAKDDMTLEEFITWIKRLSNNFIK